MFQLKRLMGSAALLALGFASNASGVLAQDARAAAATLPPVYTDARIVEWSADFLAARKAKLEQSVAADLARQDAHILSAHVWLRVQESLGRSRDQAVAAAPPEGRSRVQAEATLEMLEEQGRSDQILARFAPENLPRLSYFAQFILSEAADQLGRVDEALRYRMLRLEVDPDGFAAAWDMVDHIGADQRESTRRALRARLDVAELRPSLSARYLGRILQDPGLLLVDKRALAQTLWRERPDWYQLRFLAGVECNLHRPKQCAALRRQADALYPFRNGVVRIAVALMLGGQDAEARRLLHERALLFAPPGAPAQRRETLDLVAALGEAGEYGEQRKALNEALVRYPDEVALHLAMARLDAFSNRPAQAAEQWREVLRLAPQHLDAWLGLIRAHRSADDPDGAADVLRRAQTTLGTLTPSLMIESLGLLQARARHGEAVLAGESALARRAAAHCGQIADAA